MFDKNQQRVVRCWLFCLLAAAYVYALFVPPLYSPDEQDHFKRAYLLSQGGFFLTTPSEQSSGMMIDGNLQKFIEIYRGSSYRAGAIIPQDAVSRASTLNWGAKPIFSSSPGTGLYFPGVYTPQAIAIFAGRGLGWSILDTYQLARLFNALTTAGLIIFAASLAALPTIVVATLSLPMSLFQMGSTSIDGVCHALTMLSCALLFSLIRHDTPIRTTTRFSGNILRRRNSFLIWVLAVALIFLITTRLHAAPLIACALVAAWHVRRIDTANTVHKSSTLLWVGPIVALVSTVWFIAAAPSSIDLRVRTASQTYGSRLEYFITEPLELFLIFGRTLFASDRPASWAAQFIGKLGALDDAYMDVPAYGALGLLWALAIAVSLWNRKQICAPLHAADIWLRRSLIVGGLTSAFLVIFLLLIGSTKSDSPIIQGVQGRYFILPVIMVAYGIRESAISRWSWKFIWLLLAVGLISGVATLSERYWSPRWSAIGIN